VPDTSVADDDQRKLIHYAAAAKSTEPMKFLLKNGANLEDVDSAGVTPLMLACQHGRVDNVRFIIDELKKKRADVDDKSLDDPKQKAKIGIAGVNRPAVDSWSALFYAIAGGHTEVVKLLVEEAEVDTERQLNAFHEKLTPLMLAASLGDLDTVEFLYDRCRLEKADKRKRTALIHACMNGATNVASFLLAKGCNPNVKDSSGNTALHYAASYGWFHCVDLLLQAGAELNVANEWKLTSVAAAILKGNIGIAKYLLARPGIDINFRDDNGRTVLLSLLADAKQPMDLGERGNQSNGLTDTLFEEIEDMVLNRGANPALADNGGKNALHFLCAYNPSMWQSFSEQETLEDFSTRSKASFDLWRRFVSFFVQRGCPTMKADKDGTFPLGYLLANNLSVVDSSYSSCRDASHNLKDKETVDILLKAMLEEVQAGVKMEAKGKGNNILHQFASNISVEYSHMDVDILKSLVHILKTMERRGQIVPNLAALVEQQTPDDNHTPLMSLAEKIASKGT
jgi:ankyrin repeat protein